MGLFSKKEKKNEIKKVQDERVENFELEDIFLIPVSEIPEKSKPDVALSIEKSRKFVEENDIVLERPVLFENEESGRIEAFRVNISLPIKCKGETVLWYRKKEDGIINKTLRAYEVLSEYRCYFYDLKTQSSMVFPISHQIDVVVTNQKRISESQRESTFAGLGGRGTFVGSSGGTSTSESQTFGDVNIMFEGEIVFTYWGIPDPNGLANLIKYLIKKDKEWSEKLGKQDKNNEKQISQNINLICDKCGFSNSNEAKFCNGCGHKFSSLCTKCKAMNPSEASFCNKCGFTLQ